MQHTVTLEAATPESLVANVSYDFLSNRPPYDGTCSVDPSTGNTGFNALTRTFSVGVKYCHTLML